MDPEAAPGPEQNINTSFYKLSERKLWKRLKNFLFSQYYHADISIWRYTLRIFVFLSRSYHNTVYHFTLHALTLSYFHS